MTTAGSYEFKLSNKAVGGVIEDELGLEPGEWAWADLTATYKEMGVEFQGKWLVIYARCPDCTQLMTLYRRRHSSEGEGHRIDDGGNVHPSVLHAWAIDGVEQCGFHTMPTKLLGFVDLRKDKP